MGEKTCGVDFFAGFVVGALVGAAAAMLLAPQSGEETRTLIRDRGIELRERADDATLEARRKAEELRGQAKGKAEELQAKVQDAIEEGKTAATKRKEELLAQLEEKRAADSAQAEA